MIRLTLAAWLFCLGLLAAGVQPDVQPDPGALAATASPAPHDSTSEDDGEWRPLHRATASGTESAWKWRTLHVALATLPPAAPLAAVRPSSPSFAGAAPPPTYLLHTPLLI